jgi:hypothetical protein
VKDWKKEIERERALLAASVITPAEREDIDALAERDKLRNERLANESARRDVEIERRLDAAREVLGEDIRIGTVIVEGTEHSFIVKDPGAKAYLQWEKDVQRSRIKGTGVDLAQVTRTIALVAVHDWNGITDWKAENADGETHGHALIELLKKSPGIATLLSGEATDLAGLARGDKKSKS